MNTTTLLIGFLVLLPAFGITAWLWLNLARLDNDMRFAAGFEGMDFEIHDAAHLTHKGNS